MNFADALIKIEKLLEDGNKPGADSLATGFLEQFVQLGKVAQSMALDLKMVANWSAEDEGEPLHMHRYYSEQAYNALMKGEG